MFKKPNPETFLKGFKYTSSYRSDDVCFKREKELSFTLIETMIFHKKDIHFTLFQVGGGDHVFFLDQLASLPASISLDETVHFAGRFS